MRETLSQGLGRLLGGLAVLVITAGVSGSVLTLGTHLGSAEFLVLLVAMGGLGLTVVVGLRRVLRTETAYW